MKHSYKIIPVSLLLILLGGCATTSVSGPAMITTPSGSQIMLSQAPAEEAWAYLERANRKKKGTGQIVNVGLELFGMGELGSATNLLFSADDSAQEAANNAEVPVEVFRKLRKNIVAFAADKLPAIARDAGVMQHLYVGHFKNQSRIDNPRLTQQLTTVAGYLQRNAEFNDTVNVLPSNYVDSNEIRAEIGSTMYSSDPTAPQSGIDSSDVWVLSGSFGFLKSADSRTITGTINIELLKYDRTKAFSDPHEVTYYFHPADELKKFITEEENQRKWENWK